jgi:hypothetical protein
MLSTDKITLKRLIDRRKTVEYNSIMLKHREGKQEKYEALETRIDGSMLVGSSDLPQRL